MGIRSTRACYAHRLVFYLKPWQQRWAFDADVLENLAAFVVIPLGKGTWREGILRMRDFTAAREWAEHSMTTIPDAAATRMCPGHSGTAK